MAPFEALYGRRCRSPVYWDDFTEAVTLVPELLFQMTEKLEEFTVGEQVLLRVSPMRGVVPTHVLDPEPLDLDTSLSYSEKPVRILDTKVRSTRRKDISMVKVLWSNHEREAAT
ncbi:uncharacterized protein LOC130821530 [Amaranthus tricolor]|uniref:uncharacterized protein LOC130821530 n=1 Tax=Amaranthus tricolor TaxID=29722 RepID=UPI00258F6479|nr:uncharacterized protein LOC130821530 [Amaranthus tricolor]